MYARLNNIYKQLFYLKNDKYFLATAKISLKV